MRKDIRESGIASLDETSEDSSLTNAENIFISILAKKDSSYGPPQAHDHRFDCFNKAIPSPSILYELSATMFIWFVRVTLPGVVVRFT